MSKMNNVLTSSKWYCSDSLVPDDVIFTADEYTKFLGDIRDYIYNYGSISVGALIDLVSIKMISSHPGMLKPTFVSYNYVWTSIEEFGYERVDKGDPKPTDTWRLLANEPLYISRIMV